MKDCYVSICPDTDRVFICESGTDNNLCEVFARHDDETVGDNAEYIVRCLNAFGTAVEALKAHARLLKHFAEGDALRNTIADLEAQ